MSIGGESENMSRVLVNEMSRGDGVKVRKATLRVARLEHATRDHLLYMLFCFLSPFLPTLCARTGSVVLHPQIEEKRKCGDQEDRFGLYGPPVQ